MTSLENTQDDISTDLSPMSIHKRVSWPSVLAGVVVVLVVQLALSLLGIGIGASTIDPLTEQNPMAGIGVGSGIWLALSTLISLFAGGWVAGRLSGAQKHRDGSLHGILTWGMATLLTFYFLTTAVGGLMSGAASMVGRAAGVVGKGLSTSSLQIAPGIDISEIQRDAKNMVQRPGAENAPDELGTVISRVFSQGKSTLDAGDKEALVNAIVSRSDMTRPEATATVERWNQTYINALGSSERARIAAEQKARESGDAAARGLSRASLWGFVALVLGALAAAMGGFKGVLNDTEFFSTSKKSGTNFRQSVLHS